LENLLQDKHDLEESGLDNEVIVDDSPEENSGCRNIKKRKRGELEDDNDSTADTQLEDMEPKPTEQKLKEPDQFEGASTLNPFQHGYFDLSNTELCLFAQLPPLAKIPNYFADDSRRKLLIEYCTRSTTYVGQNNTTLHESVQDETHTYKIAIDYPPNVIAANRAITEMDKNIIAVEFRKAVSSGFYKLPHSLSSCK